MFALGLLRVGLLAALGIGPVADFSSATYGTKTTALPRMHLSHNRLYAHRRAPRAPSLELPATATVK